jgi:hypothetical protein
MPVTEPMNPGVGHVHERGLPRGLGDHHDGEFLEPPVATVVEDAAVVERSVLGRRARQCESRAMEHLGNEIGRGDVVDAQPGAVGQAAELLVEPFGDVLLLRRSDPQNRAAGIEQLEAAELERRLLRLDVEEEVDQFADLVLEQRPLLVAHRVRRPLQVEHPCAVHLLEEARAAACDGPCAGRDRSRSCCRRRQQHTHGQERRAEMDPRHRTLSVSVRTTTREETLIPIRSSPAACW